jgi:microsomal dipeptidase-like Zn-dependent dipeptidase
VDGQEARGSAGRLLFAAVLAVALIVGAITLPSYAGDEHGSRQGTLQSKMDARKKRSLEARPHVDPPGTPPHNHNDPKTKNLVSRAGETGKDVRDPSTFLTRAVARSSVAAERTMKDPRLRHVRVMQKRLEHPQDRYAMANGCYDVGGQKIFFKPTDLGQYLLYTTDQQFLVNGGTVATPSDATIWTAVPRKHGFSFTNAGKPLVVRARHTFRLKKTTGCTAYPEAGVDVSGKPHAGVTPYQEVRGYVDAHTHGMAFEFLGGDAHCGKPWDRFGAPYALVDCPDHMVTGGYGGVLEDALSGTTHHDPIGWPTFKDWPAPESLTHEGTYWKWLERSWRGGQRIFVNLLVENNQLCMLYPLKRNSCDDMDSIRLQAHDMYKMQDYIDAQFGGPGKGFYRIVTNPFEARKVVNAGKMAVVMGIETSVPFGCSIKLDVPTCSIADIDRQLDEVRTLGVRQMELVNKFDNALSGVAGDTGEVGALVNAANFLETGSFWDMRHCEPADGQSHDKDQVAAPGIDAQQQDALFGAIAQLGLPNIALPLYPPPDHCNSRGLTTLGEHTIKALAQRHMIFDPDHMSVKARASALDTIDQLGYHGVVSSHSWATPDAYPRIYAEGGFITPYAGDSTGFVDKWRTHVGWADPRYYWGIGYGADMNGLGAQGNPRGASVTNPVTYPFKGIEGATIRRQTAGLRTWDINTDGVAQYGLYPDWIQDLAKVAGSSSAADARDIEEDISRGPEAYLQMWERAEGIQPDSCRNPSLRRQVSAVSRLIHPGMSTRAVMNAVGQPYTRLGRTFGFCAKAKGHPTVRMTVAFTPGGKVVSLHRGR